MAVTKTYQKEFKGLLASLKGEAPVAKARAEGMEAFASLGGIPVAKAEDWRYSDLSLLRTSHLPTAPVGEVKGLAKLERLTDWPLVVIRNGSLTDEAPKVKGLEILATNRALVKMPSWAKNYTAKGVEENPLERLNLALAEGGIVINIQKNAAVNGLEILFLEEGDEENARHLRNLIRIEDGANAQILVRTLNLKKGSGWVNMATNISLGKKARLSLVGDFEQTGRSFLTSWTSARLAQDAALDYVTLSIGLPSLRNELEIELSGKGARANLKGGLLAAEGEVVDFVTRIFHISPGANSNQTVRAVAGYKGQTAFQGRVVVEKDAQKTEAHQTCHNLILERSGEANVKPVLLIFADDVICSHGATVGEIDQSSLFYMMQRGIPEAEAKALMVRAFLGDVVEGLKNEGLRSYFEAKIYGWMQKNLAETQ